MSDLKNDWVYGDTVMASDMNDIANAVNSKLDASALDGVAQESSVQAINTKIGTTTDTGGTATTGTVMGKLNALQIDNTWGEYLLVKPYKQVTIDSPLTITINGSGEISAFSATLYPNRVSNFNKLTLTVTVDNETILEHIVYCEEVVNYSTYSRLVFGIPTVGTVSISSDTSSNRYQTYSFPMLSSSAYFKISNYHSVFDPTTYAFNTDFYYAERGCFISTPIKFTQNFTATISTEDFDSTSGYYCYLNSACKVD